MTDHQSLEQVLKARGGQHGEFLDHAALTQRLKREFRNSVSYDRLIPIEREAVEMILHKLGRIGSGNPHYRDHWIDIAGYATLVADRIEAAVPDDPA